MKCRSIGPLALLAAAGLLGGGSLLGLAAFLFYGSFQLIDLGLDGAEILVWDGLLALAFSVQHSGMIRKPVRRFMERFLPEGASGAFFALASGTVLLLLLLLWQRSSFEPVPVQGTWRWCLRAAFLLAAGGFAWAARSLRSFDTLGIRPVLNRLSGRKERPMPMIVRGPYRWVRHPLYLFTLVLLWSCPDLTADRLLLNVLWSGWIVLATRLEERDLEAVFGESYRRYRREVPMLIPHRARPAPERVVS
ncbi:MAG: isoprenylcysteine carboxylmethyltransferase family protein [Deltaproteobacteria bacterium]|nr:isoprenylcysteine carboxylmethyltransferase family protein [Deltaproteobacteria bacterium]